jgi:hypothetical protein
MGKALSGTSLGRRCGSAASHRMTSRLNADSRTISPRVKRPLLWLAVLVAGSSTLAGSVAANETADRASQASLSVVHHHAEGRNASPLRRSATGRQRRREALRRGVPHNRSGAVGTWIPRSDQDSGRPTVHRKARWYRRPRKSGAIRLFLGRPARLHGSIHRQGRSGSVQDRSGHRCSIARVNYDEQCDARDSKFRQASRRAGVQRNQSSGGVPPVRLSADRDRAGPSDTACWNSSRTPCPSPRHPWWRRMHAPRR